MVAAVRARAREWRLAGLWAWTLRKPSPGSPPFSDLRSLPNPRRVPLALPERKGGAPGRRRLVQPVPGPLVFGGGDGGRPAALLCLLQTTYGLLAPSFHSHHLHVRQQSVSEGSERQKNCQGPSQR